MGKIVFADFQMDDLAQPAEALHPLPRCLMMLGAADDQNGIILSQHAVAEHPLPVSDNRNILDLLPGHILIADDESGHGIAPVHIAGQTVQNRLRPGLRRDDQHLLRIRAAAELAGQILFHRHAQ